MAKANVKMADIAQALGVSTVAVSKALAGQKGVSEELRERIKKTAEEMGYRSPKVLRQVKYKSGFNIGVLICERYVGTSEAFYWKLYQELTAQAMKRDCFVLLELLTEEDMNQMHMPKLVTENKADGLIIIGKPANHYATELRKSWNRPVLFLDFYEDDLTADEAEIAAERVDDSAADGFIVLDKAVEIHESHNSDLEAFTGLPVFPKLDFIGECGHKLIALGICEELECNTGRNGFTFGCVRGLFYHSRNEISCIDCSFEKSTFVLTIGQV